MRIRVLVIALLPVLAISRRRERVRRRQSELSALKQATAKYHDVQAAIDAGYVTELPQTTLRRRHMHRRRGAPLEGAMGIHMVDTRPGGRLDGTLDADRAGSAPVRAAQRRDAQAHRRRVHRRRRRPSLLYGQQFARRTSRATAIRAANVWTLHAWVWKPNPSGMFEQWNDRVTC